VVASIGGTGPVEGDDRRYGRNVSLLPARAVIVIGDRVLFEVPDQPLTD
jgi:hypothetical protein